MKMTKSLLRRIAFSIGLFCCLAAAVQAATYQVNSSADNENTGCGISPDICTLREAVNAANSTLGIPDSITFAASVTTITLANGEISITGDVEIGSAMSVNLTTILGANGGRIFNIAAGADTTINKLELANGLADGNGGAILNNGAVLTVNDSVIRDNEATAGTMGGGFGGGIYTSGGTVSINRSTVGGNNRAGGGGGIYNLNGTVNLTNSTVTNNISGNIGGGYYGFADLGTTTLNSVSSTIAFNTAVNGGGIAVSSITGFTSRVFINNTIISNNNAGTAPDVSDAPLVGGTFVPGTITSTGYNLITNTSGATITPFSGDRFNVDPALVGLLPLGNNGGLTPTHGLKTTSPVSLALDQGNTAVTEDQRGFDRNDDFPSVPNAANGTDIGAFEAQVVPLAATVTVGGRVLSPSGKGISRARISMTDSNGVTRAAMTNFFGYYRFNEVPAGETYIFSVATKFHSSNPQIVTITEELADLNFIFDF